MHFSFVSEFYNYSWKIQILDAIVQGKEWDERAKKVTLYIILNS